MLNGDGNENGIKINRSNQQKNKLHVKHTFFSHQQQNKFAFAARFSSFLPVVLHNCNTVFLGPNRLIGLPQINLVYTLKNLTLSFKLYLYDPSTNKHKQLECREFVKYLGVLIDYKLSWNNHIDTTLLKISRTVGLLSKLQHFVPFSTNKTTQPHLQVVLVNGPLSCNCAELLTSLMVD